MYVLGFRAKAFREAWADLAAGAAFLGPQVNSWYKFESIILRCVESSTLKCVGGRSSGANGTEDAAPMMGACRIRGRSPTCSENSVLAT